MPLRYLIGIALLVSAVLITLYFISPPFFLATILSAVGFTMVWRTTWWLSFFGRVSWAEEHLAGGLGAGAGGSWLWYKLLGIVIIVGSILYVTGSLQAILTSVLGPFFGGGT